MEARTSGLSFSRLSIVVVTRNSAAELPGMLGSVRRELGEAPELVVVDNHSSDETLEVLADLAPGASAIALTENQGFGAASNLGVRSAHGDVVVLLNPDTVLIDDSLIALADLAGRDRALVGARLLNEDRTPQISAFPRPAGWEVAASAVWPGSLMPRALRRRCEPWRCDERLSVGWLSAACMAARRDLLLELGPFRPDYPLYGEDTELCLRAGKAGVPSMFAPDLARVVHLGSRSGRQEFSDVGISRKIAARRRLVEEHYGRPRVSYDTAVQFVQHGLRWVSKALLRRDASFDRAWLEAASKQDGRGSPRPESRDVPRPISALRAKVKAGVVVIGRSFPGPVKAGVKRGLAIADPLLIWAYRLRSGYRGPIPPIRLRARVGTPFVGDFVGGASKSVAGLDRACRAAGRSLSEFGSMLDFGCGCARITGTLAQHARPEARVAGCDVDRECIEWSRGAFPELDFEVNSFGPPLPFEEDAFDLICSISIFTHLDEQTQLAWLRELDRILMPGGLALLTVFNEQAFEDFRAGRVISNSRTCARRLAARRPLDGEGFVFEPYERSRWNDADFEGLTGAYGLAFHHQDYLERAWDPIVQVIDRVTPQARGGLQDIVVVSPRRRESFDTAGAPG